MSEITKEFRAKQEEVVARFTDLGYILCAVSRYPYGVMISSRLYRHKDWQDYVDYDSEHDIYNMDRLLALPTSAGDIDWKDGTDIIEL
jgi:hypothetical protein